MRSTTALLICSSLAVPLCATDWPMYLGDLRHSSNNPAETRLNPANISQLLPLWKVNTANPISSAVTLAGGTLYFGDWSGSFHAVNAATGAILWKTFVGHAPSPTDPACMSGIGVSSQPVVTADSVYVGGGDSALYALNRTTGEIRWRTQLADPNGGGYLWSSVMLSANALYIGIASLGDCPLVQGGVARIPLDNPSQPLIRYLVPDGATGASVWSTPALDEAANLLYLTTGNAVNQNADTGEWGSALLALDATTLEIKAHFFLPILPTEDDADWGSSPTLFQTPDGHPYVAATGKNGILYVLDRPSLGLVWQSALAMDCDSPGQGCGSLSTPAFDGSRLIVGAGQSLADNGPPGTVHAFDAATGNLLWLYPARGIVLAPVTLTPGLVFAPTVKGLAVLNSSTGAELWTDRTGLALFSQAAVADGVVYCTYTNGDVVAFGIPNPLTVAPAVVAFSYTSGGAPPVPQRVSVSSPAGILTFTTLSDSPWLSVDLPSAATPAVLALHADVAGLAPGLYQGKVTVAPSSGPAFGIAASLFISAYLPPMTPDNAATFQPGALAPGSLFTIFAPNLALVPQTAPGSAWPTTLGGVSVTIDGIPAPIGFTGPTQVNAQVPFETAPGAVTLILQSNGTVSAPAPIVIAATAPGIFLSGQHAAAINQDGTLNGADAAPGGSVVSVYFTGQGQVDHPPPSGAPASAQTLSHTLAPTSATIGGFPAPVTFSGLAPGYVGLGQANIQIPVLVPGQYPLILTIGNISSNPAMIDVGGAR